MKLFIGLGNPGDQYANTRHNIGFTVMDAIAAGHSFSGWSRKFQGHISEGRFGSEKVILLKPATFMNLSGQSAGEAARFFKLENSDITIFYDELDLAPGKCRLKVGGGHAGHNGIRSLHQHLGPDYNRVRLGIGHPGQKNMVSNYVLGQFTKSDQDWLNDLMWGISDGVADLVKGDGPRFLNAVANRTAPARPSTGKHQTTQKPEGKASRSNVPKEPVQNPQKDTRSALQKLIDKFS